MRVLALSVVVALAACASGGSAPSATADLHRVDPAGAGADAGTIAVRTVHGEVALELHLRGLPPGEHGMHLHANASCDASTDASGATTPAGGAGAHFDPSSTGHHAGPMGQGHLGDLPIVTVDSAGNAHATLTAPRFHSADELRGHAIIIHAGGDNYNDTPPLGGGGARIACGVVN